MKRKLTFKSLLLVAAMLLGGVNSVWAQTTTVGANDKSTGFLGAYSSPYTLAPNQTLTLTFTNNGSTEVWNNWVTVVKPTNTTMNNGDLSTYYFLLRSDLYGWGQYYNASHMRGTDVNNIKGLDGTTVTLTVEREGATIKTRVIATNADKSYEQDYRSYNVGDGTQDIEVLLSVDHAQIVIDESTKSITSTSMTEGHTIVGNRDRKTLWWNQYSDYYKIEKNQSLTLDFDNYTSGSENAYNWVIGITNDVDRADAGYVEYLILRSDNYGWGCTVGDEENYYYKNGTMKAFNYPDDWADFRANMDEANVKMTVTRDDNGWVCIYAIMSKDGVSDTWAQRFYFQLPEGMRTEGTIRAFLIPDHSYLDIDNTKTSIVTTKVIGKMDCTTAYLTESSDVVTLTPGSTYNYKFVNYNNEAAKSNWANYVVPVYKLSDGSCVITVRADNWEDLHRGVWNAEKNTYDYGSNAGCTSDFTDWDHFTTQLNGASVDMNLTFTASKVFKMSSTITTSAGLTWTYSYTSDYSGSAYDLTGEDAIKVALSVSSSWLELFSEGYTAVGATLGTNGYATFANGNALDLSRLPDGLTAWKARVSGTNVNFTKVTDAVPANTGLLLWGGAGETYAIPVASSASTLADNAFEVNTSGTTFAAESGSTYYGMNKNSNPLTFGRFNPASVAIPANKAYLKVSSTAAHQLTTTFDEESTGIGATLNDNGEMTNDKPVYNLAGQRVSKPAKGLYIVSGKKYIVK